MMGATLFSGGEGVGCGMRAAGVDHLWGIEYDQAICDVATANGFTSICADITTVNTEDIVTEYGRPDILHASPPCPNFSIAKTDAKETALDKSMANAVCDFIDAIVPKIFTLENVRGYLKSESFATICAKLSSMGYSFNWWALNSADYGVPQTRRRLVLIAIKGRRYIARPQPTHKRPVKNQMSFSSLPDWVGWYEAIEDLIPTLKDSELAPWQLRRDPSCNCGLHSAQSTDSNKPRPGNMPSTTVTATYNRTRAVFISGQTSSGGKKLTVIDSHKPAPTVTASPTANASTRIATPTVKQLNTRALARLQSFHDSYELPEKQSLACRVIGNAVPPLLYQRVIESAIKQSEKGENHG